uniref:WH2 domain-containing protein n=1 Tax=Sinocyclocheilus anshuiensis TaxID=1608454 RepID=A0A671T4U4_9TELE
MSTFGYRRELSKYEDLDEDELLASLTAKELQELEKELTDIDPDDNLPIGLEALMKYWENETRKLLEEERIGSTSPRQTDSILKELKNALRPINDRENSRPSTPQRCAHDELMAAIRGSSIKKLKRVSIVKTRDLQPCLWRATVLQTSVPVLLQHSCL